jgi:glycosyltransferase involved in cell wall biosynthesis
LDFARVPILRRARISSGLSRALRFEAARADLIHGHGLWLAPNIAAGSVAALAKKPLIVTPRGMLSPTALAFSRVKKRVFWWCFQERAIGNAACLHATSDSEYRDIREFGLTNPIAIIPNGIDLPEPRERVPVTDNGGERVVLSLGRIHPKKGLDRLVRAWALVEAAHPKWRLRIVGPSEVGHDIQLRTLTGQLNLSRVSIEPAVYGAQKLSAFQDADLFVLPTLSENFGLTVAESLAAGTPVISTKGAPWAGLESESCGWWIEHGPEPLAAVLRSALSMPREELRSMGARGRVWMARDFTWDRVARDMVDVYGWLVSGNEPPSTVLFN